MSERPHIFVYIASYRDPECQWTVKDLFEKARFPERVFVGICWQLVPEEDADCFTVETRPRQVRTFICHALHSRGMGWARGKAQDLWDGEPFALQIDSHMRFVPGWDEKMIDMSMSCGPRPVIITTHPPHYDPPDRLGEPRVVRLNAGSFDEDGVLHLTSETISTHPIPAPLPTAFSSGGFIFGPSAIATEIRSDPYLYFAGEEILLSVRFFTHGLDLYVPSETVIYHYYGPRDPNRKHWVNNPAWHHAQDVSAARIRHILGTEVSEDPEVLHQIDHYGLGTARPLAQYEDFSGVNFRTRQVGQPAYLKHI